MRKVPGEVHLTPEQNTLLYNIRHILLPVKFLANPSKKRFVVTTDFFRRRKKCKFIAETVIVQKSQSLS